METSSIKTPFPGQVSVPSSFVSLFIFYILSYLPSKTMGCFSGCLMSAASDQKLFCELCSPFNCSFDEFVGEKVVSPSYSSAILTAPLIISFTTTMNSHLGIILPIYLKHFFSYCRDIVLHFQISSYIEKHLKFVFVHVYLTQF